MIPALVACSHGTHSETGRRAIRTLVAGVRERLPGVRIEEAFVDVQQPRIAAVVDEVAASGPVVVVPLLLSAGYHTRVDIAGAVAQHADLARAAPALGPHDALAALVAARASDPVLQDADAVVLAAAGSTDPAAEADVRAMARLLEARLRHPVAIGFAVGAHPRIDAAIAHARAAGARRVVAVSYVLAPGHFADVVARSGADVVTGPLAPDDRITDLIVERYTAAAASFGVLAAG